MVQGMAGMVQGMAGVVPLGLCSVEQRKTRFGHQGTGWELVRKTILIILFGVIALAGAGVAHADSLSDPAFCPVRILRSSSDRPG
jgi:hypothetical protein